MSTFYIVPGVYPKELDLTGQTVPISTTIGALVFASRRGPTDVYFETNTIDFENLYGPSDFSWTFGHAIVKSFLTIANAVYLKRVTNNAKYAGMIVTNDVSGVQGTQTYYTPFPRGRIDSYIQGGQQYIHINFSSAIITGNTISLTLTSDNNNATHTFTQTFTTDNDTTLATLATSIDNIISTDPFIIDGLNPGDCSVIDIDQNKILGSTNNRILQIFAPEGTNLTVTAISISGGTTQASATVNTNPWLFEVWAQNPGQWASNGTSAVGFQILNVDQGLAQRIQLAFSDEMITGESFTMTMNLQGQQVSFAPVAFTTDWLTTLTNITGAISTALGIHSEVFVQPDSNNLAITIVSPVDGPNTLVINNPTVNPAVNDTSPPAVIASNILTGIASDQSFDLWVYTRDNINVPIEKHHVSFLNQTDGNGIPLFIETVINNSGSNSDYIRIRYNTLNGAAVLNNIPATGTPIYWLSGGDDGILPSNSQIAQAWSQNFSSRRKVPCRILINGGYSSPVVQQMMDSICQSRWDCFSILDMPTDSQKSTAAVNYRNNILDINSSYSAIYTPDIQITDGDTGKTLFIPPSGNVAAKFAYNDNVAAEWYAPAGLNRGLLLNVTDLAQEYDDGDMAILIAAQINPIIKESGAGYQIKSANTLQVKASALSNINVRRLLITIEVSLVDALNYSIYEPNTSFTRFLIVQLTTNFLQPIKDASGLYDFAVVCDDRNNPGYLIDEGQADVDIYLKPVLPIKFIQLTSVITKTGAYFQEIIAAVNAGITGVTAVNG